ncbi:MAG: hypothetical protein PHV55_05970, partial [Candidatus Omnitrophica bacterium]|nr:hypothetical protein [Candidatus Omnitrophota bacterium]
MYTFHRRSFTLIEIVITLVISTAIVLGVMALMNFSTVQTNLQSYALTQNVELTYAERFIKNKVSNAEFVSLEGPLDESNRATGIIIKPWASSGKPESKIVYIAADHALYFYPNKATATKTVISHNTAALFYNSKEPAKTTDFKLLSFTLTQSKPSNSTLANIVLTSSVYAKLGSKTIGYVFNVNKRRYYPTIQRGVDDADPGNELRCMGNVGAYFNGVFNEHAIIDKSLIIKGGYSQDFNDQDICATPTTLQRSVPGSAPLDVITLAVAPGDLVTLDGFVFRQANPINGRGSLSLSQSKFYGSAGMVALLGGTLSISRVYFTDMHPWTAGIDIHRKIIDFTNRDASGVYYTPSSVTIDRFIMENNGPSTSYHKSIFGYGVLIGGQPSSFTLTNSKFTDNYLMDNLIAVCSKFSRPRTVTINNCSFTNNKSSGSLVYVAGDNVTMENSTVALNTLPIEFTNANAEIAADNVRSAVDIDSSSTAVISNCKMNNNSMVARFASILHLSLATQLWPIPSANYLQVTLNRNQFLDNDIVAENGAQGHYADGHIGGIVDAGYSRVSMNNCDVQRNNTSTVLLGLYGDKTYGNPTLIIRNSNISNNNINTYRFTTPPHMSSGGGFYTWALGTIDLKNFLVT